MNWEAVGVFLVVASWAVASGAMASWVSDENDSSNGGRSWDLLSTRDRYRMILRHAWVGVQAAVMSIMALPVLILFLAVGGSFLFGGIALSVTGISGPDYSIFARVGITAGGLALLGFAAAFIWFNIVKLGD